LNPWRGKSSAGKITQPQSNRHPPLLGGWAIENGGGLLGGGWGKGAVRSFDGS